MVKFLIRRRRATSSVFNLEDLKIIRGWGGPKTIWALEICQHGLWWGKDSNSSKFRALHWYQWIVINSRSQRTHETESEFVPKRHGINSVKLPTLKTIEKRQRLANYGQLFFGTSSKGRLSSDNFMDIKILSRRWFHNSLSWLLKGCFFPPGGVIQFSDQDSWRNLLRGSEGNRHGTDFTSFFFPVDRFQNTLSAEKRWLGFAICCCAAFLVWCLYRCWIEDS